MLSICQFSARAQSAFELGGLAGASTRMGFGARGISMGNALSAVTNVDGAAYYNPASVSLQSRPSALLSVGFLSLDRSLNYASYSQSIKPSGGFSLALINAGVSKIQGRDDDALPTSTYSTSENEFLFSFGSKLNEDFAVGVSAKIFYFSLFSGVKSTTVGFDVGLLYLPTDEWAFGLVLADLNSKYKWDTSNLYGTSGNTTIDRFPLRRKLAACYSPSYLPLKLSGELERIGLVWLERIGTEVKLHQNFALTGGLDQINLAGRVNAKPSFGFSLQTTWGYWSPALRYGYVIEPYSPTGIHLLALSVDFQ